MARNGSGTFSRLFDWTNDRDSAIKVNASRMDDEMDGIATALSESIARDGQTTTTAAIPFAVGINTNTIAERTAASGVTIDSVLLKDGALNATASSTITSTDAGATEGPSLTLHRNSASPAASDLLGALALDGESSTSVQRTFAKILAAILDPTNASEDATLLLQTIVAGTLATRVTVGQGVQVGSPTGGDPGTGKINATDVQINGGPVTPIAAVLPYAGLTEPTGWLFCYGQAVSRSTYAALFTAISTTYGAGDGSTTFNLPDLRGRVVAGQDDMGGTSANRLTNQTGGLDGDTLGATGGAETHTLTLAQIPSHTHTPTFSSTSIGSNAGVDAHLVNVTLNGASQATAWSTTAAGSGGAHNNVQPTFILNYIIRT